MGTGTLEDALAWVEYCNRFVGSWPSLLNLLTNVSYTLARLIHTTPIFAERMVTMNPTASRLVFVITGLVCDETHKSWKYWALGMFIVFDDTPSLVLIANDS